MTAFDDHDDYTYKRCQNYISNIYSYNHDWRMMPSHNLTSLNTDQLDWKIPPRRNNDTWFWCSRYIREHGYWPGKRRGGSKSRKQQSKRKNLRLRNVSKKY